MRMLMTGGAGFLDSHLCQRKLQGGHEVICLDDSFTVTNKIQPHISNSAKLFFHERSFS